MNIINKYLTNKIPRPRTPLYAADVKAIVIHYPGVANQTALQVIKYWDGETGKVGSAHYVIDLDGTIYCAIPDNEKAYHVGSSEIDPVSGKIYTDLARSLFGEYAKNPSTMSPNRCAVGIEMCHIKDTGEMSKETVNAGIELVASLCKKFKLDPEKQVVIHKDVVGWKNCHLWYIKHPDDFSAFKTAIKEKMNELA